MTELIAKYKYAILVAAGIAIGITGTLIAQRCNVEEAMKPLYFVIEQLGGRVCK